MKITKTTYLLGTLLIAGVASAAAISTINKWSWGEGIGWINWNTNNGAPVEVTDTAITGEVWSQTFGWINLNPTNAGVTNTCGGNVGGYAWGQQIGWINMDNVFVNPLTGLFAGTATTTNHGQIVFSGNNFQLETDWRCSTEPTDTDGDGLSDALENELGSDPNNSSSPYTGGTSDADADGVSDAVEQYLADNGGQSNTTPSTDSDGDGVPDITEVTYGSNPFDANSPVVGGNGDTDGDGVTDATEYYLEFLGGESSTNSTSSTDTDGDGIPDAQEIAQGSNPMNQGDPVNVTQANNGAELAGYGIVGATITVTTSSGASCSTTVAADGTWTCMLTSTPVDGESVVVTQSGVGLGTTSDTESIAYASSKGGVSKSSSSGGASSRYYCRDPEAINYTTKAGKKDNALCRYEEKEDEIKVEPQEVDSRIQDLLEQISDQDSNNVDSVCEPYLSETIVLGKNNNPKEVDRLIQFLNEHEGENLTVDGAYDQDDFEAVKRFQNKHADAVLKVWGLQEATGHVYLTTRMKINSFKCNKSLQCPVFTEFNSRTNENNNTQEVQRTKVFMSELGFYNGPVNTSYDDGIYEAIKNFQETFAATMLDPWGLSEGTGYKYKTTNKFMNEMVGCTIGDVTLENGATVSY